MNELPVCVIEDNTPIRKLFCTLLRKSGYNFIDFADGQSALEWLKENKPQAILLDILLPDTNGTELLKEIRALHGGNDFAVIAVTGFANANDRDKYIQMGFDSYISKPVNTATFVSEIQQAIDSK